MKYRMKKNILITWTSKWIWNYLLNNLKEENDVIWISRTKITENWFEQINIDLTKPKLFNNIINYLEQSWKKLDIIIINAWLWHFWKYEEGSSKKYEEIINLNLLSPILLIKELEPYLNKKAKIIFIWSIISKKFMKYGAVYQASKFGLRWFAWALKNELWGKWIHIINPRIVDTDFHNDSEIEIELWTRETRVEDISNSINWIISWKEKRFEIDL
jgi:short-subunit dehydrogenase